MNSTTTMDEKENQTEEYVGTLLASIREKKGYSREYVAGKLHLRTRVIELLEEDNYPLLPQPVFIKGYIRAYAKLLNISPEPFLTAFNRQFSLEAKPHQTLWQSKRPTHRGEILVRSVTGAVVISALLATGFWWQKNKDSLSNLVAGHKQDAVVVKAENPSNSTSVSRLSSLFSAEASDMSVESQGD